MLIDSLQGDLRQRIRSEMGVAEAKKNGATIPEDVPRALHRFYERGKQ